MRWALATLTLAALGTISGCLPSGEPPVLDVHSWAHGCYAIEAGPGFLARDGDGYRFSGDALGEATPFRFQPSDLGTYLLYDPDGGYVVARRDRFVRETELESDMTNFDDGFRSGAEWDLQTSIRDFERYQLRSHKNLRLLGRDEMTDDERKAMAVSFVPAEGCAAFPELQLNATGSPARTTWDDGDVYGIVEMHTHILTNFGFGGAMFHGSPFHPLGVEHALGDCDRVHGEEGRKDFFGYTYDATGNSGNLDGLVEAIAVGEVPEDNHHTDGYPTFSDWPNARTRSTHQVQYYRWLERAWLAGLRLVVQHATGNAVICNITVGAGWSPARYGCEDMTGADRQIQAAYELERYIDAQWGGPGRGFFRVVGTPQEAREVIADGKMAVVLGLEVSDLFDCHLTPREGGPTCDEAHVDAQLDDYYARGVRVLFPNHKYDNAFTPGDGSSGFIEAGNFLNSGHYTNKVSQDCPTDVPAGFDDGEITFGGLNEPRDTYLSPAPEDLSQLGIDPVSTMLPFAPRLLDPAVPGEHCQNGTLTPVGEHLLRGMMRRGMVIEVDHLPRRSYKRAYELLAENDYPATGTHGRDNNGKLYEVGGLSIGGLGRCHDPDNPRTSVAGFLSRVDRMVDAGMHPSLGITFDLNGLAGGPRPRFGPDGCGDDQINPVTYPFASHDGGVSFTEPWAGERLYDFNNEGMAHIGLFPEYLEDLRRDGATDDDLEPLFRSAEGYIRMWEKAEARGQVLSGG